MEGFMRHMTNTWRFALTAAVAISFALPTLAAAQAMASSPAAATAGSPAMPAEYRLVPGDKIRIEVYKDTQLSQSLQIRPDGKITMPLIGDVTAMNQTPTELRQ